MKNTAGAIGETSINNDDQELSFNQLREFTEDGCLSSFNGRSQSQQYSNDQRILEMREILIIIDTLCSSICHRLVRGWS